MFVSYSPKPTFLFYIVDTVYWLWISGSKTAPRRRTILRIKTYGIMPTAVISPGRRRDWTMLIGPWRGFRSWAVYFASLVLLHLLPTRWTLWAFRELEKRKGNGEQSGNIVIDRLFFLGWSHDHEEASRWAGMLAGLRRPRINWPTGN